MTEGIFSPSIPLPDASFFFHNGLIFAEGHDLFMHFGIGRRFGESILLSPFEAAFLGLLYAEGGNTRLLDMVWPLVCTDRVLLKHLAVYIFFRARMWVVRDGSGFGFDFVLYRDHPDQAHSEFGVLIIDDFDSIERESILCTRVAWSVKKSVILITVHFPENLETNTPECLKDIIVTPVRIDRETTK